MNHFFPTLFPRARSRFLSPSILRIVIALLVIAPSLFVLVEANHDCSGDDCPICHEIAQCIQVENEIGSGAVPVSVAVLPTFVPVCLMAIVCLKVISHRSLVSLKVRLDI